MAAEAKVGPLAGIPAAVAFTAHAPWQLVRRLVPEHAYFRNPMEIHGTAATKIVPVISASM
jgi:hypothetical protein